MTTSYNVLRVRILEHGELKEVEVIIHPGHAVRGEKGVRPLCEVLDKVVKFKKEE